MQITRLYRGPGETVFTKYTIGKYQYTFDQVQKAFHNGARGVPNNPKLDGQISPIGEYLVGLWPHFKTDEDIVRGWVDAGFPASWYYVVGDSRDGFGYHRFLGQTTRIFNIVNSKQSWIDHNLSSAYNVDRRELMPWERP